MRPWTTAAVASVAATTLLLLALPAHADFADGLAAYERGDYAEALRSWRPLADEGLPEAQFNLGLLFDRGLGTERDAAAAHAWYLRAAEAGYPRARLRVAEMYAAGEGVRPDLIQAHFWFTLAKRDKVEGAKKHRRQVAGRMTPKQIAFAEMLVRHHDRDANADAN